MSSKWQSRKFWESLIGIVIGLITTVGGGLAATETVVQIVTVVTGATLSVACILGYLISETKIDVEREMNNKTT